MEQLCQLAGAGQKAAVVADASRKLENGSQGTSDESLGSRSE